MFTLRKLHPESEVPGCMSMNMHQKSWREVESLGIMKIQAMSPHNEYSNEVCIEKHVLIDRRLRVT